VVAAGVCAALHVCKLPPALPLLQLELGIGLVQAGFLLSFVQLAGLSLGLGVGLMADRWGLKRCMLIGLLLLSLASIGGSYTPSVHALLVLRAIEGLGFLLATMPAPALIRRLVQNRRMSAMLGWWGTYMPLAAMLALLIGPYWMDQWGWSGWWLSLGLLTLLMTLRVAVLLPPDPPVLATSGVDLKLRVGQTLSLGGPWCVAGCFSVYSCQWMAVIGFMPTLYAHAGYPVSWTPWLTALVAGSNLLGNVASGQLLSRGVQPHKVLWLGFGAMASGALGTFAQWPEALTQQTQLTFQWLSVWIFSTLGGVVPGTLYTLAVRVAPNEHTISSTVGWMQQWSALGQFTGPPLVAATVVWAATWNYTWCITMVCALAGMALACRFRSLGPA
jgi:MFS family permease